MKLSTDLTPDLFGMNLPSRSEISDIKIRIRSNSDTRSSLIKQLNANKDATKASLPTGIAMHLLGRNAEAVDFLGKAEDCKEKYIYLALAQRWLGDFDASIKNLDKAVANGADALEVAVEKAATYRYACDFEAADKELRKHKKIAKKSSDYHYELGRLRESQGIYDEAMANYGIVLEIDPNCPKALFRMAYRCDLSGNEETAIGYYKRIIAGTSVYVSSLLNLAVIYEDREQWEKAAQCADMVLKYYPNHPRAILFRKDIESSKTMMYDEDKQRRKDRQAQLLETPITDFELSVRSRNCFEKMNINTLGDLLNITEAELLAYKNFGETSLKEIKALLASKGLSLGMAREDEEESSEDEEAAAETDNEFLKKPITELKLSVRAEKCLEVLKVRTIGQLLHKTEAELLGSKNFGSKSLEELKEVLSEQGLNLRQIQ